MKLLTRFTFASLLMLFALFAVCIADDGKTNANEGNVCSTNGGNCTCTPYGENGELMVNCKRQRFTKLPNLVNLPKTGNLDMSDNEIHTLEKLEKNIITHLSLHTNQLKSVANFAFELTQNLIFLDLSFNSLNSLPETLFDDLGTLQYLNLSYNNLEFLPKDIFKKCNSLFELRLGHNPMKQINGDTFVYLNNLEILDLSHNEIFSLESTAFHAMTKLDSLDLSHNDFDSVPINTLRGLKSLIKLDLSNNPIKTINEASFYKLDSLKDLTMNHMRHLVDIKKKAFSSLSNLQILSIQDNPLLSYIDPYAFKGIFNHSWIAIREVSFRRNSLSTLAEGTLPFCNLTKLDLTENPWRCDCHLHWIKYCEDQHKKTFQRGLICANPEKLRGHELDLVEHKKLVCEKNIGIHHSSMFFSISIFFMFLMLITLIIFVYRDRFASIYGSNRKQGSIYYVRAQSENEGVN
ncbi:hypothetical protein RDWZM_001323 [Blomia tropicalis]|uniref:LRRCT domain-containing protein n=1 Tax=Blomia tropicalis TaxID=40697 RepID=A0A9Q0MCW4_BLOTA|nr:hypothetical protein RDWZM_001323 [Blomia tropicalis]